MKVEESLNVTFDESPPPTKLSPLVDDDVSEEEAIENNIKVVNNNNIEDESIEVEEIVNIKESKNHPLEQVIGKPKNVNEALEDECWVVAMQEELNQFVANDILDFVPLPKNQSIIGTKCVHRNKLDGNEVFVVQTLSIIDFEKPNYVYKLKKALYGLKQALKAWYDRLKAFLLKHEYSIGIVDNTLFTKKSKSHLIIVQIYVDDIIFGSTCQNLCDDFAKIMHDEFEISMIGELSFFLGLQIKKMEDGIFFNQSKYIKEMLKKFGLKDSKPTKTLMSTEFKLTKEDEADSVDSTKYRELREDTFSKTNNKDAYDHVSSPQQGSTKRWVDRLILGVINTWDLVKKSFIQRYCPPSKTAKRLEDIHNFKQESEESLNQAWERYNDLLYKCPTHDINSHQKWHDGTSSRNISCSSNTNRLPAVIIKLDNLGCDMKKLKENVHAIQVGCQICEGPHLDNECPLNKEVKPGPPGYYTHTDNQTLSEEKRPNLVETINKYVGGAAKRQAEQDKWLKTFCQNTEKSRIDHDKIIQKLKYHVKTLAVEVEIKVIPELKSNLPEQMINHYVEPYVPPIPFPNRLKQHAKEALVYKTMESLRKIRINRPLLKEIRQTNNYPKFMKELMANEQLTKEDDEVSINPRCSALLQNQLPPKENDPRSFILPCSIGRLDFNNALADLGASISIMPFFMFKRLGIGKLEPINMVIEMADSTKCIPKGIVKNLFLKFDKFILLIDFVILDIIEDFRMPVILGRPLLATAHAKIDIFRKTISLEVGNENVIFKIRSNLSDNIHESVRMIITKINTVEDEVQESYEEIVYRKKEYKKYGHPAAPFKEKYDVGSLCNNEIKCYWESENDGKRIEVEWGNLSLNDWLRIREKVEELARTRGNIAHIRAGVKEEIFRNDDEKESYDKT
ncbi:retrovirus-related pol polyprotein from transposon TNT 1-94 [Tanacetum coccineum]